MKHQIDTCLIDPCLEVRIRLAHMGIFPIVAIDSRCHDKTYLFYIIDVDGLVIGTSVKSKDDEQILLRSAKENKHLTNIEHNLLKDIGLLKNDTAKRRT